ncbi:MAG TPA: hypothetical protein PLW88_07885, partial [Syntrophorhabdaceae bacterium]|nr:hypothetical protein [Syntrophorhabdaceae bacterium]
MCRLLKSIIFLTDGSSGVIVSMAMDLPEGTITLRGMEDIILRKDGVALPWDISSGILKPIFAIAPATHAAGLPVTKEKIAWGFK